MFGRFRNNHRGISCCYFTMPNTANQNLAHEIHDLNSKFGKEIEITGINDRDLRKNYFTGLEMMSYSLDRIDLSALGKYEYIKPPKVSGGGGSGACDVLLQKIRDVFIDSPILIPIEIITENPSIRAQINSALSIYVNLRQRGKGPIWIFSNSELVKNGGSYSSANEKLSNLIWSLSHAHNDESSDFDLSAVSQGAFTGAYAEIYLQKTAVDTERSVVMTAKKMLTKPWIDSKDLLWNDGQIRLLILESVVVCLVPDKIELRSICIDEVGELENVVEEFIKADYPYPVKIKENRKIPIHFSLYPGKKIKIVTMTKISENTLEKAMKSREEFLKRIHDAAASKKDLNAMEKTYLYMYREEYRRKPREGKYPWEKLFEL